jgi:ribose 5-phosphate isomerase B
LKVAMGDVLRSLGHDVLDVGAFNENPSDYPDFAEAVGQAVLDGKAERGVLICGSGVGASVAVNKLPGIRGSMCHDTYSAHQGVEHDDINVLVLGSRVIGVKLAEELVKAFLGAKFTNEERHVRRLGKVKALETKFAANSRR